MDADGTEWTVRKVETPQPWARGAHCLIFSSSSVVRRVWNFPDDWERLPSRSLLGLVHDDAPRG